MPPPLVFTPPSIPRQLSPSGRLAAALIAGGCLLPLLIASQLTPSPDGAGTHTRLGFQTCSFLRLTGIPCASCGMTTSFAWFVRGNLLASAYIQPMGMLLAFCCAGGFWIAVYCLITGRPAYRLLLVIPGKYYVLTLVTMGVIGWGWKIGIHLLGHDGWH